MIAFFYILSIVHFPKQAIQTTMNCSRQMNNSRGMNASGMNASGMNASNKGKSDKKYCGVCHKAGKTASEYESHYTKSVPGPYGIVTCPMILSSVCNRCGQSGHFSDHCTIKKNMPFKNNRLSESDVARARAPPVARAPAVASHRSNNVFAALAVDDEDDLVMPVVKRPKITVEKEIASLAPNGVSFAAMLLKPAPAPIVETGFKISPKLQTLLASEGKSEKLLLAEEIVAQRIWAPRKYCSWADMSDTDTDEDYVDNSAW